MEEASGKVPSNGNGKAVVMMGGDGASPITGQVPPNRFSKENQPKRKDPFTDCLKAYLGAKANKDGSPRDDIRVLGKFPPRMMDVVEALVEVAADKDHKSFGQAQRVLWDRAAGKSPQEHQHRFPNVSESISIHTDRANAPLPSEN